MVSAGAVGHVNNDGLGSGSVYMSHGTETNNSDINGY